MACLYLVLFLWHRINHVAMIVVEDKMDREKVLRILKENRHEFERFGVISVRVFGSVARDEASDLSDVDVLAEFERPLTFKRYMGFKVFLEDLLGLRVDLVTERGLRERVRPFVEKDAIRVA